MAVAATAEVAAKTTAKGDGYDEVNGIAADGGDGLGNGNGGGDCCREGSGIGDDRSEGHRGGNCRSKGDSGGNGSSEGNNMYDIWGGSRVCYCQ